MIKKQKKDSDVLLTLKDRYGFYDHVRTNKDYIVNSLLWCKKTLPDIWENLQTIPDDVIKNMSLKTLIETYYRSELICLTEVK